MTSPRPKMIPSSWITDCQRCGVHEGTLCLMKGWMMIQDPFSLLFCSFFHRYFWNTCFSSYYLFLLCRFLQASCLLPAVDQSDHYPVTVSPRHWPSFHEENLVMLLCLYVCMIGHLAFYPSQVVSGHYPRARLRMCVSFFAPNEGTIHSSCLLLSWSSCMQCLSPTPQTYPLAHTRQNL